MLTEEAVLQEFRDAGALLEGHFILSSGMHSSAYLQCARVLMDARRAERLCAALASKLRGLGLADGLDLIVSPAMGGVVVGYEMGRQLGVPAIFFERVEGKFQLRRVSTSRRASAASWSKTLSRLDYPPANALRRRKLWVQTWSRRRRSPTARPGAPRFRCPSPR